MRNWENDRFSNFKIFKVFSTLFKHLTSPFIVLETFDKI